MTSNSTLGFSGFFLGLVLTMFLAQSGHSKESLLSIVALTLAIWITEYKTVRRSPSDFSCGFVFILILGLSGFAALAFCGLLCAFCLRHTKDGKTYPWDLLWTAIPIAALFAVQALSPDGADSRTQLLWDSAAVTLAAVCQYLGSSQLIRKLAGTEDSWQSQSVEREHSQFRLMLIPYALIGILLPQDRAGLAALALPFCLAVQAGVSNLGFKIKAQSAQFAKLEAHQSRKELAQVAGRLDQMSRKQRLLENLVEVFERSLSPQEAFVELCRTTKSVVEYRSIILFRLTEDDILEPFRHESPETDLLSKARLMLRTEPLVEKAWSNDRPYRGVASTNQTQRLLPNEAYLLAIPLKPFGVLYFGRESGEPYTKAEASKLLFVAKRAESALVRAEREAQSQEALVEQTTRSEVLQQKVALTSRLLQAAQNILSASSPQQIAQVLRSNLEDTSPFCAASLRIFSCEPERFEWGTTGRFEGPLYDELIQITSVSKRALYLPHLSRSKFAQAGQRAESLILVPLRTENEIFGHLMVTAKEAEAFATDLHDFICTLGCLAAGGLESQHLSLELRAAHDQVVQSSKLSAIGQLAAGVAHELNTPLAAISLAVELASLESDAAAATLQSAEKALDRAQSIVAALLKHSRQKDADRELVVMASVVKDVQQMLLAKLQDRGQELQVQQSEAKLSILANHGEIQQILTNLIQNASDASDQGARILLHLKLSENRVLVDVIDRGSGISDQAKPRIFDPFFTTKAVGKGTGLGLSVCRELVSRHRGQIDYQDNPEGGTIFRLSFPARLSDKASVLD